MFLSTAYETVEVNIELKWTTILQDQLQNGGTPTLVSFIGQQIKSEVGLYLVTTIMAKRLGTPKQRHAQIHYADLPPPPPLPSSLSQHGWLGVYVIPPTIQMFLNMNHFNCSFLRQLELY